MLSFVKEANIQGYSVQFRLKIAKAKQHAKVRITMH